MQIALLLFTALVLIRAGSDAYAQTADTILLQPVQVAASRIVLFGSGSQTTVIDSASLAAYRHQHLGDVLNDHTAIFIKSYGPGSTATISSRGTEARHTAVLWNGFNLNSASLGLSDVSTIPALVSESVQIIHGGSAALNGNAALGSTIILEQAEPRFSKMKSFHTSAEYGSFSNYRFSATAKFSSNKVDSRTTSFYHSGKNNFSYRNIAKRNQPEETQKHACAEGYGVIQDLHVKTRKNHVLSASAWYQVTNREIPPMMTVPESGASQLDSNLRLFAGYKITGTKMTLSLRAGYFNDIQCYNDILQNLQLTYKVINYHAEAEWIYHVSKYLRFNIGSSFRKSLADFTEYHKAESRIQNSIYGNIHFIPVERLTLTAGIRKEIVNGSNPPLSPQLAMQTSFWKGNLILSAKAGNHYNLPGMNDLYWVPGGDAALKPENAWSGEAGISLFQNMNHIPKLKLIVYKSTVENWITWQPAAGGIYAPNNLREVKTRGFETQFTYKKSFKMFTTRLSGTYGFSESILSAASDPSGATLIGNQLPLIPEHMAGINCEIQVLTYRLHYHHSYTGMRYTTSDNTRYLDRYNIAFIRAGKDFKIAGATVQLYASIQNLYNSTYQVLPYRPVPGRWYHAGLTINI